MNLPCGAADSADFLGFPPVFDLSQRQFQSLLETEFVINLKNFLNATGNFFKKWDRSERHVRWMRVPYGVRESVSLKNAVVFDRIRRVAEPIQATP